MNIINVNLSNLSMKTLALGFEGEANHTKVVIHCNSFFAQYPSATAVMVAEPPVGDKYPISLVRDGNALVWNVSANDLTYPGSGRYQLTFTQDNEIIKTVIGSYSIEMSLKATGQPPTPFQNWLTEAQELLEELKAMRDGLLR